MTVYWVVWDAAAHWVVDRLAAEGALPAVAKLRAMGCRARARPPAPNCQTPPSLATLFTGTGTEAHGVTGFTVPDSLVGRVSGFAPHLPLVPTVWRDAGVRGAFSHTPWVFDGDGAVPASVDAAIEAYSCRLADRAALAVSGPATVDWPAGPCPVSVTPDGAAVRLLAGGAEHRLTEDAGWVPVRTGPGTGFWVRLRRTTLGRTLVRTGTWSIRVAGANAELVRALAGTPVFAGESVGPFYRSGLFGPRLVDGGDGTAEAEFTAALDCVALSLSAPARAVLEHHRADLVVLYLPWTDDVGHELVGWCDARSAAHHPEIAGQVWAHVRHAYQAADRVLADVLARADVADTVLLCADHGITGTSHHVHVNQVLVDAGLAVAGPEGIDPDRSLVVYHPANNGSMRVNPDLVPPGDTGAVLRRAMTALRGLGPVLRGFLDERGRPVTEPVPVVFAVLADDYQPQAAVDGGPAVRSAPKSASHVVNTGDPRLHAVFAAAGPGIEPGTDLGVVDNTLAARVVREAVAAAGASERCAVMNIDVDGLLQAPADDLVATRYARVLEFIGSRGLSAGGLGAFLRERVGPGELLLTSSPVHGLANPTSDFDFIRVQAHPISGARISTKIFDRGHHLEVTSFAGTEVRQSLHLLDALAARPPAGAVAGFRGWDRRYEPRRKQTERIVNGVTLDGRAPYLAHLPALARVWSTAALHTAAEQTVHLCLAEAAGEARGRVGYAYNVLLHLMDSMLSAHGDVYTTRKWYVMRWARFVRGGAWRDDASRAAGAAIERARVLVSTALAGGAGAMAGTYTGLLADVARATGVTGSTGGITAAVEVAEDAGYHPYLPGAGIVSAGGRSLPVTGTWPPDLPAGPVGELAGLDRATAGTVLRAVRAGLATVRIGYLEGSAA
ncbi:MAG TPA: DUF6001 family protein [Pseudonocardiaceae bacterium]|nr:DUF6001 family protein [Pseudonocardiaceae bacterium]